MSLPWGRFGLSLFVPSIEVETLSTKLVDRKRATRTPIKKPPRGRLAGNRQSCERLVDQGPCERQGKRPEHDRCTPLHVSGLEALELAAAEPGTECHPCN